MGGDYHKNNSGAVADDVWDELKAGHTTANSFGKIVQDIGTDVTLIKDYLGDEGIQLKYGFSTTGNIEEGQYALFAINLHDVSNGAIASGNIDITSISAVLSKSTGGGAFSSAGITQPTFAKANGVVSVNYQFLSAEWELGDAYRLTVAGVAVTIGSDTMSVPGHSWVASITEQINIESKIDDIDTVVDGIVTDVGDPSGHTLTSLTNKWGDISRSLDLILGSRWDASGDLGTDIGNIPANTDAGVTRYTTTTEDLQQAAGTYDLLTGTTQDVILTGFSFKLPNVNASDDATLTSIAVHTDDVTNQDIITSAQGAVANLTAEAEISWEGFVKITVGTKLQLTIAGGAADDPTVTLITARYEPIVDGGTLT